MRPMRENNYRFNNQINIDDSDDTSILTKLMRKIPNVAQKPIKIEHKQTRKEKYVLEVDEKPVYVINKSNTDENDLTNDLLIANDVASAERNIDANDASNVFGATDTSTTNDAVDTANASDDDKTLARDGTTDDTDGEKQDDKDVSDLHNNEDDDNDEDEDLDDSHASVNTKKTRAAQFVYQKS